MSDGGDGQSRLLLYRCFAGKVRDDPLKIKSQNADQDQGGLLVAEIHFRTAIRIQKATPPRRLRMI